MRGMTIRAATIAKTTRQKASRLRATGEGEEKGKSSPVRIRREASRARTPKLNPDLGRHRRTGMSAGWWCGPVST